MRKNSLIYVAGHSGLVGSSLVKRLKKSGYKNILTRVHKDLDLIDRKKVMGFFAKYKPEYVFLAAARVGGIHANDTYPAQFIYENLMIQANVIDIAFRHGTRKLLFFASSCVYPKFCGQPMKEEYLLSGHIEPTSEPFAIAKLSGIKMCQAYNKQYGTNFISVIPANIYGINDHFDENAHVLSSLLKRFSDAKTNGLKKVLIWGSGKPKREFLYADDLADACLFLMQHYNSSEAINIGTGIETSIKELAGLIRKISGFNGDVIYDTAKPDGNPRRFLDTSRINSLGWRPRITLEEGLKAAYAWLNKL